MTEAVNFAIPVDTERNVDLRPCTLTVQTDSGTHGKDGGASLLGDSKLAIEASSSLNRFKKYRTLEDFSRE